MVDHNELAIQWNVNYNNKINERYVSNWFINPRRDKATRATPVWIRVRIGSNVFLCLAFAFVKIVKG